MSSTNNNDNDNEINQKHTEFFSQFKDKDDRSSVILIGSLLDVFLEELLNKALLDPPNSRECLVKDRGPINNLYSKNLACYQLGLIDNNLYKSINIIRDIRNKFAHKLEYNGLDSQPYRDQIESIWSLFSWYEVYVETAKVAFESENEVLTKFKTISSLTAGRLKEAINNQKQLECGNKVPFIPTKWEAFKIALKIANMDLSQLKK